MASEVSICNLALGYLGDSARVSSINPPEGSAQSQHCARFYPIARNALLEMFAWTFATTRAALVQVDNSWSEWQFAYAAPNNIVDMLAVLPSDALSDTETTVPTSADYPFQQGYMPMQAPVSYTPQPYAVEIDATTGNQIILTNVLDAVLRYVKLISDPNSFSPLFQVALSWLLASMLAGPLIKGDAGAAESKRCAEMFRVWYAQATEADGDHGKQNVQPAVPWIAGR